MLSDPLLIEKAKAIRLLICDVDGVLTTGVIYYLSQEMEMKGFHVHDGLGIKLLQKAGIPVAVISAKNSAVTAHRLQHLDIAHAYLGHENKLSAYEELKQKLRFNDNEIAFIGDDLPDLALLRRVGLAITVPQAPAIIQQQSHCITTKKAGKGAVREVCEFILQAQAKYESVIESYLTT